METILKEKAIIPLVNEPPGICFVHLSAGPGGIETMIPVLAQQFKDRNPSVFVVREADAGPSVYAERDLEVVYGSRHNALAIWRLFQFTRKNRFALFQVYNIGPLFLLVMRLAGAGKIIYNIHGTIYWRNAVKKWILKATWAMALSRKVKLVANSEFSALMFKDRVSGRYPVKVIYNPLDTRLFQPAGEQATGSHRTVVYCGRLVPGKGLERWIDVAVQAHRLVPDARFSMYGSGILKEKLQARIQAKNAGSYISINGYTNNIASVYRNAGLLLFLSEYESFGNAVVESILCGTPVLAADIPSMREIFAGYPEFLLTEQDDIALKLAQVWERLDEYRIKALQVREEWSSRFSLHSHIEALKQIHNQFG